MRKRIAFALLAMALVLTLSTTATEAGCVTCGSRGGQMGCVSASNGGGFCTVINGICLVDEPCSSGGGTDIQPKVDPRLQANWLLNPRGLDQKEEAIKAKVLS